MALSPAQLELRRNAYGASEIATIVGVGGGSLVELYESKVFGPKPEDAGTDDGLAMRLGNMLEEPTAKEYALRTKTFLASVYTLRHPTNPLVIATPDRVRFLTEDALRAAVAEAAMRPNPYGLDVHPQHGVLDAHCVAYGDRLVEVKTTASRNRGDYGPDGSSVVPEDKAVQVTVQMAVTGQRVTDIPVLFRGEYGVRFAVFTVGYNEALYDGLAEAVARFHRDHVLAKKPPPPDGSDRYDEFLGRAFPAHGRPAIVASDSEEQLLLRYAQVHAAFARLEKIKRRMRQELVTVIGDAEGITSASLGGLSYRRTKDSTEVDWQVAATQALQLAGLCLQGFDTLAQHGEQLTPENRAELVAQLQAIVPNATKVKPGHRVLRTNWKGEADLAVAALELKLDALEQGE